MKAVVIRAPGHAVLADEAAPRAGEGQVLVRVAAAGICMSDIEIWKGTRPEPYVRYPAIPGHEWCGTVEQTGPGVQGPSVGQRVAVEGHNFCRTCAWCRHGQTNLCATYREHGFTLPGGFAEYVVARADLAHPFSEAVPFEAAALTEPFACVVHAVRRTPVERGDTVVVLGSGTLSLLAAAYVRVSGAAHTVVVTRNRTNETVARAIGATEYLTVDEDPVARVRALTGGRGADVVLEAVGHESAVPLAFELARRGGAVALMGIAGSAGKRPLLDPDMFALKDARVQGVFAYTSRDYADALRLIDSGRVQVQPLITHRFALRDFQKAFDLLATRREPVVKVLLQP